MRKVVETIQAVVARALPCMLPSYFFYLLGSFNVTLCVVFIALARTSNLQHLPCKMQIHTTSAGAECLPSLSSEVKYIHLFLGLPRADHHFAVVTSLTKALSTS